MEGRGGDIIIQPNIHDPINPLLLDCTFWQFLLANIHWLDESSASTRSEIDFHAHVTLIHAKKNDGHNTMPAVALEMYYQSTFLTQSSIIFSSIHFLTIVNSFSEEIRKFMANNLTTGLTFENEVWCQQFFICCHHHSTCPLCISS